MSPKSGVSTSVAKSQLRVTEFAETEEDRFSGAVGGLFVLSILFRQIEVPVYVAIKSRSPSLS